MQTDIQSKTRINVACGDTKFDGYWNIDAHSGNNPDQIIDISREFPFESDSAEEIVFFHGIEHIEEKYHISILQQFHRVLKSDGWLYISYPEFTQCAENYIHNFRGQREFWKATIYGLQRFPGDYHVSLMDSSALAEILRIIGFKEIAYQPEMLEPWNSIIRAQKSARQANDYQDIIAESIKIS